MVITEVHYSERQKIEVEQRCSAANDDQHCSMKGGIGHDRRCAGGSVGGAAAAEGAWVHADGGAAPGCGHWGYHGDFLAGGRDFVAAAAVPGCGATCFVGGSPGREPESSGHGA